MMERPLRLSAFQTKDIEYQHDDHQLGVLWRRFPLGGSFREGGMAKEGHFIKSSGMLLSYLIF